MITIQVKDPYVSVYRSGLRLTYGKTLNVSPEDPRVLFWLENGFAEEAIMGVPMSDPTNEIRGGVVVVPKKKKTRGK